MAYPASSLASSISGSGSGIDDGRRVAEQVRNRGETVMHVRPACGVELVCVQTLDRVEDATVHGVAVRKEKRGQRTISISRLGPATLCCPIPDAITDSAEAVVHARTVSWLHVFRDSSRNWRKRTGIEPS